MADELEQADAVPETTTDTLDTQSESVDTTATIETTAETIPTEPSAVPPPLFAGKFKTAEEAYWHSQGELNALRQGATTQRTSTTATPKYTTDQLWGIRAQKLQEMTQAQIAGEGEKAGTLAANINWIDNEIQQQGIGKLRAEISGRSALDRLVSENADLLKPYQADLVPGNPLFETAQQFYSMLKQAHDAGVPMENILLGMSVLAAAAKTGKNTAGVQQEARAEFAGALKQSIKQAVITGAGKASKTPDNAPDFHNMTDKQFDDYRRKIGMLS